MLRDGMRWPESSGRERRFRLDAGMYPGPIRRSFRRRARATLRGMANGKSAPKSAGPDDATTPVSGRPPRSPGEELILDLWAHLT